jgi:D-glycero-alpha-D-manno-heptose-7-phosphate kinase
VTVSISPVDTTDPVVLDARNFGDRYPVVPGAPRTPRHPLLEAALDVRPPPAHRSVEVVVRSTVPPGCGTGTSAAVAVAMLGALAAARGERLSLREIAYEAHRLEVEVLGAESGIQDQLCAAFGGINYLEIEPYPHATVHRLAAWDELSARLTLVFLGRAHHSSGVHHQVIEDGRAHAEVFARLRAAATAARDAVLARDLVGFGDSMIANTEAQRSLHPALVGTEARRVIELAAGQGAIGWKVNGAGGGGGSVTLLSASVGEKRVLERRVSALSASYRVLPIAISNAGLRITDGVTVH